MRLIASLVVAFAFSGLLPFSLALAAKPPAAPPTPPPAPKPQPLPRGIRPAVPEWHDRYDMPWDVTLAEMPFSNHEVAAAMQRADAAARRVAQPEWTVRAAEFYPYLSWNAGSSGYSRTYQAQWESGGEPIHNLSITADLYDKPREIKGFSLRARWQPKQGWMASLHYGRYQAGDAARYDFGLALFHPKLTPKEKYGEPHVGLQLTPGAPFFSTSIPDDDLVVRFFLKSRGTTRFSGFVYPRAEEITPYWESPESFRDAALAELALLEKSARKLIPSGVAGEVWTRGGPSGGDAPHQVGGAEDISDRVRSAALDQALAQIAEQKRLVEEHFKDMHRAATAAFPPLQEIVESELAD